MDGFPYQSSFIVIRHDIEWKFFTVRAFQSAVKNFDQCKDDFSTVVHGYAFIIADIGSVLPGIFGNPNGSGSDDGVRELSAVAGRIVISFFDVSHNVG